MYFVISEWLVLHLEVMFTVYVDTYKFDGFYLFFNYPLPLFTLFLEISEQNGFIFGQQLDSDELSCVSTFETNRYLLPVCQYLEFSMHVC